MFEYPLSKEEWVAFYFRWMSKKTGKPEPTTRTRRTAPKEKMRRCRKCHYMFTLSHIHKQTGVGWVCDDCFVDLRKQPKGSGIRTRPCSGCGQRVNQKNVHSRITDKVRYYCDDCWKELKR